MALASDFQIDKAQLKRAVGRMAARYPQHDFLAREIGRRMEERLDYIKLEPKRVLDIGCGPASDRAALQRRYPQAQWIGGDLSLAMLRQGRRGGGLIDRLLRRKSDALVCADAEQLPLARASCSLVWSNLMLTGLHDPLPALREMHRVLEVGGMVMFSTLGPDTLKELRAALPSGAGERVHRFIDMHDLGDALVQAGFSDPVMDMEMLTLTYGNFDELLDELRAAGGANASTRRPRGLAGRKAWAQARAAYETLGVDGRLPVSVEIIQGHAWKPEPRTSEDGRAVIRFEPRARR